MFPRENPSVYLLLQGSSQPPLPTPSTSGGTTATVPSTAGTSSTATGGAVPPKPVSNQYIIRFSPGKNVIFPLLKQSFPLYYCGPGCKCNEYGKEKLRELVSTSSTDEHMRENLHCKETLSFPQEKLKRYHLYLEVWKCWCL